MDKHIVASENAARIWNWLQARGGLAVWESINMSNPGASWTTPANKEDGTPTEKPTWQADSKPMRIITDPADVVVSVDEEVKRFRIGVRMGVIVPNGSYDPEYNKNKGSWHGTTQHDRNPWSGDCTFSVGLMARAYVKVTAHRKSGDQIAWERAGENCHSEPDNYLDKLNSFIGGAPLHHCDDFHEIPYTEEAAKFFYEAMLSICKLSDRIESFFGNPENVQKAIESRSSFMLGAGK